MPKKKAHELMYDPKYITVHTDDRYINGPTARVVSKKLLRRIVSEQCETHKAGECNGCFTENQELEYPCISAWKMTVGKGPKLY